MAGTMRGMGRSLLVVEVVITSHDNRGAPAFSIPAMSRDKFGGVLAFALEEQGTIKSRGT